MTDKEQKDLRSYCAFILKEYGFDIPPNDPIIPALYVIHKEMQLNNESNKALALQVKEAAAKINPTVSILIQQPQHSNFNLVLQLNGSYVVA